MTVGEIDHYLDLMGYAPLRKDDKTEGRLIRLLDEWESSHPFQRAYKDMLLSSETDRKEAEKESSLAAHTAFQEELLFLREEMYNAFKAEGASFPYMNR